MNLQTCERDGARLTGVGCDSGILLGPELEGHNVESPGG